MRDEVSLKIGDKVRATSGLEGKIVSIDYGLKSAMIRLTSDAQGPALVACAMGELVRIDVYSIEPERPT